MVKEWQELKQPFAAALVNAFNEDEFAQMLDFKCEYKLDYLVADKLPFPQKVYQVLDHAQRNGWLDCLAQGALETNQSHAALQQTVADLLAGIAAEGPAYYQQRVIPAESDTGASGQTAPIGPKYPSLSPAPPITAALPTVSAEFVGRRDEIDDLKRRLSSRPIFVSLVGMGGIGKSTLALAAAHELIDEGAFADGIFWIDVREHTTLGAILAELAGILQLELSQETLSQQQRAVNFSLRDREALMILDNLESSVRNPLGLGMDQPQNGAESGFQKPQLEPRLIEFLSSLPCVVLATSRVRPANAQIIELLPLPSSDAVRLFQQISGLKEGELDQESIDLCNVDLEGHPLAIAVVGSLVATGLEVAEIRGYLQEMPLDIFSESVAGAGRSVVDALQLSYKRLSSLAQALLTRMSIFPADFDLTALMALTPEYSRLKQVKGLRELIERSLLTQVSRQSYRLHPVTRQFAYAMLDDPALYHRRAGAYFLTETGADSLAALEQLIRADDEEQAVALILPNISAWINAGRASKALAACYHFTMEALSPAQSIAVYEARGDLHYLLGEFEDTLFQYEQAVELAAIDGVEMQVRLQRKMAEVLVRQGDYDEALGHLERGREFLAGTVVAAGECARVALGYGTALLALGRYDDGIAEANVGLNSLDVTQDDPCLIADLHDLIGKANFFMGDFEASLACFQMALSLRADCPDPRAKIKSYSNLATIYGELNHYTKARQANETALEMAEKTGDVVALAVLYVNIAGDYLEQGMYDQAIDFSERSLILCRKMGDGQGLALAHDTLGRAYLLSGHLEQSAAHLDQAIKLAGQVEDRQGVISGLKVRAELHLVQGKINEALEDCLASLQLAEQEDNPFWRPEILDLLGQIHHARQDWGAAEAAFDEASQIWRERKADLDLARTLFHWAKQTQAAGKEDRARELSQEAEALANAAGDEKLRAAALALLAELAAS